MRQQCLEKNGIKFMFLELPENGLNNKLKTVRRAGRWTASNRWKDKQTLLKEGNSQKLPKR